MRARMHVDEEETEHGSLTNFHIAANCVFSSRLQWNVNDSVT